MLPKKQHYVPQLLLRRFTPDPDAKEPKTTVCDLVNNKKYPSSIKSVAYGTGFYNAQVDGRTETLETWLSTNVETPAGAALGRLLASQKVLALSSEDLLSIARFVATLAVRGRQAREEINDFPALLLEHLESRGAKVADELRAQLQPDDNASAIHNAVIQGISQIAPALVRMGWRLARPPQAREFCSSDNPVVRFNPIDLGGYGNGGLLSEGMQLQLAISPEVLLLIADPLYYGTSANAIDLMSEDNLLHYNSMLAGSARQFLFSRSGDFDVRPGMYSGGVRGTFE